jgi:hypothetical protein
MFRAKGATAYLENGGTLALRLANIAESNHNRQPEPTLRCAIYTRTSTSVDLWIHPKR